MAEQKPEGKRKDKRKEERNSEWERFDTFVKRLAAVPKEEVDEKRAEREKRVG